VTRQVKKALRANGEATSSRINAPEIPPAGALIDPNGSSPTALDAQEYTILKACLNAVRGDDQQLCDAAKAFESVESTPDRSFRSFMDSLLIICRTEDGTDLDGILLGCQQAPLLMDGHYDSGRSKTLAAFLKILRGGGWFADWLELQVRTFAEEPLPTPLEVMSTLTLDVAEFEEKRKTTAAMLKAHPHLFSDLAHEEPAQ
jgi:hypothetical protein